MSTRLRRRTGIAAILGLLLGLVAVLAGPSPANAEPYAMKCTLPPTLAPQPFPLFPDIDANVPASVEPGDSITLTGTNAGIFVPGSLVNAAVALGILAPGANLVGNVTVGIASTNVSPASQNSQVTNIPLGTISGTFIDANSNGSYGDVGDTVDADDISNTVALPNTTWTGSLEPSATFRATGLTIGINIGFPVNIVCTSGGYLDPGADLEFFDDPTTPADEEADNGPFVPATDPFATTTVAPEVQVSPVANTDSGTVSSLQDITIDVAANDTDANGDLDPTSVAIGTAPTNGTAVSNGDGTVTYTNTNGAATSDTFTYTINDGDGTTPAATGTVNITITSDPCDATNGSPVCDMTQVVDVEVIGASLTMSQTADSLSLADITLNGQPQVTNGSLNDVTVVNRRGTDNSWTLNATATDWILGGSGLSDCSTPSNKCIPKGNLNWAPSANVAHTVIPGDVAAVTSGPAGNPATPWVGGFSSTKNLCATASTTSGGTFLCDAALYLGIPASAAKGNYVATITLTLS